MSVDDLRQRLGRNAARRVDRSDQGREKALRIRFRPRCWAGRREELSGGYRLRPIRPPVFVLDVRRGPTAFATAHVHRRALAAHGSTPARRRRNPTARSLRPPRRHRPRAGDLARNAVHCRGAISAERRHSSLAAALGWNPRGRPSRCLGASVFPSTRANQAFRRANCGHSPCAS